jgi:hypothetical protein
LLFQNKTPISEIYNNNNNSNPHYVPTSQIRSGSRTCPPAILPVRRQTLEVSMGLLMKSVTTAVLVVTTLLSGGNAWAAPLGAPLALRDALTPAAQLVQWGGGYDDGSGYGDVGYGGYGYGGYGGGYGGYLGNGNYRGYGGGYGGNGGYGDGNGGYGFTLPPQFRRSQVDYITREPAGTIIIDTPNTYLYLVLGNGRALRYGIGVGREGFTWSGTEHISRKAEWPDWSPPAQMIERQPYLPRFMAGGETNPLGARALYLGNTLYRIHGTNQPWTIGTFVSSGCIRLTNEDITDLYGRIQVGTRVIVLPAAASNNARAGARSAFARER